MFFLALFMPVTVHADPLAPFLAYTAVFAKSGTNGANVSVRDITSPSSQTSTAAEAGLSVTPLTVESPLIEKTPYGEINWTSGYIVAYGTGAITRGLDQDICDTLAQRAALLDAHTKVLAIIQHINIDGNATIRSFVAKNDKLLYSLKGLIARVKPFEENKADDLYHVRIRVPFYGVKGIQAIFLETYLRSGSANSSAAPSDKRIVIDARGTGVRPSLFVRIITDSGRTVYTARDVDRSVLRSKGMAAYRISTTSRSGDTDIKALQAEGKQSGNLVISSSDAETLKQPDNKRAFSNGHVVIITDPNAAAIYHLE